VKPWLIVAGDFRQTGGMDRANYHLAWFLAESLGQPVSLVAHQVAAPLAGHPNVRVYPAARPFGSHLLGEPFLDRTGRRVAARLRARDPGTRVVVNGGNCLAGGVSWVHYVHAAAPEASGRPWGRRVVDRLKRRRYRTQERRALQNAPLVIANSERTRQDLIERLGTPGERARVVYLAAEPGRFRPPTPQERAAARERLGWPVGRPVFLFVGSPRDHRKGLDVVLSAWRSLAEGPGWDGHLAVVGAGAEDFAWQRGFNPGLRERVHGLKLQADLHHLYWACDSLVSPTRYEPYGLAVHEALCSGLPALVSRSAGVAERYPPALEDLLLPDPEDAQDLARRVRVCRAALGAYRRRVAPLGETLRARSWDDVAGEIVALVEQSHEWQARPENATC
jgi:glycosyltransferase involved in cell wall biosynthesis